MCPQEATRSLAVPKEESWRFPPATDSVGLDVSWTCSELRWKKNLHRFFESFMGHQKNLQAKRSDSFYETYMFFKISSYFCWILLHWDEIEDRISSIDCPLLVLRTTRPQVVMERVTPVSLAMIRFNDLPGSECLKSGRKCLGTTKPPLALLVKRKWCQQCNFVSIFWYIDFESVFFVDSCKSPQLTFVSPRVVATNLDSLAESPDP